MTTTTISLADLGQATTDYLRHEVAVAIGRVTSNVETDEEGTFTVRVTNAELPQGIRLRDVTVHLTVSDPAVLKLDPFVGTVLETRATGDRSDPRLPSGTPVGELFVFFPPEDTRLEPSEVLEPGDVIEFEVTYVGDRAGTTGVTAHLHASFDTADLFPRTHGSTVDEQITILRDRR